MTQGLGPRGSGFGSGGTEAVFQLQRSLGPESSSAIRRTLSPFRPVIGIDLLLGQVAPVVQAELSGQHNLGVRVVNQAGIPEQGPSHKGLWCGRLGMPTAPMSLRWGGIQ